MNRKELVECMRDEKKFLNYSSKEIMEAIEKYKTTVEIIKQSKQKELLCGHSKEVVNYDKYK